tara:strand:+ start:71 stop:532 length:462 start_codon:yes stop_codon:yes gene_type:complete
MSTKQSSRFLVDNLVSLIVLGSLILSSSLASGNAVLPKYNMTPTEIMKRIKPIGEVYISDAPQLIETHPHHEGITRGEEVVIDFCNRCHVAGLMHSPKLGKTKDWAPRLKKGIPTLHDHAIHGLNKMPARGGKKALSDADIEAAVDYMISLVK